MGFILAATFEHYDTTAYILYKPIPHNILNEINCYDHWLLKLKYNVKRGICLIFFITHYVNISIKMVFNVQQNIKNTMTFEK